ncbi:glycosyltransferase family 66 protein, partial [Micromonas pusilla CCMP1545]
LLVASLVAAYRIRLYAVRDYGRVIHEFDPWFNFRATQYLVDNGREKFFKWFDHSVWYPLGRPVGTTIYPGMQFTAAGIYNALNAIPDVTVSLNDVCVFMPAAFSVLASLFTGGIAWEAASEGNKASSAVVAIAVMAIQPGHLMRSVAGAFDNESVAVTAITGTFYWWVRSLRTQKSWQFAFIAAASYFYMVAAWGGYTFVVNMIGVHAGVSMLAGRFSFKLWRSYSIFYALGTAAATRVPVVGMMPFQSMEQMGPLFVFFMCQLYAVSESRRKTLSDREYETFRKRLTSVGVGVAAVIIGALIQSGKIGPLSARVRGLFVPHTRTGNPLVDSVAEHQATQGDVYVKYFHFNVLTAPCGAFACLLFRRTDARVFVASYFLVSWYFSSKMVRLVLLLAPAVAVSTGIALGAVIEWVAAEAATFAEIRLDPDAVRANAAAAAKTPPGGTPGGRAARRAMDKRGRKSSSNGGAFRITELPSVAKRKFRESPAFRKALAGVVVALFALTSRAFSKTCDRMALQMSEPSIMVRGHYPNGDVVMLDDFRESYWWLRDNTPEDARVMSWWDYGYQINGVANRTTLADGNTWNHEHIALLGKCLTSPEEEGYQIVRHLADYVLVWTTRFAGMHGDDLAKAPHMARIAGSVYPDVRQEGFYVDERGNPSDTMRESLLYRLHSYGRDTEIEPLEHYEEVYQSKHSMVRIWKVLDVDVESKGAGAHRACDGGGWYCPGGYPDALRETLASKRDFQQI